MMGSMVDTIMPIYNQPFLVNGVNELYIHLLLFVHLYNPISTLIYTFYWLYRFKFDDDYVTKEDMRMALDENYGGEEGEEVIRYMHMDIDTVGMISYDLIILDSFLEGTITLHICLCTYVKLTRRRYSVTWMSRI